MPTTESPDPAKLAVEMQRVVSIPEAARLCGLSTDTLRRRHRDKFIRLSPRRIGMRVGDVLDIGKPTSGDDELVS
jgi:hypothetical protein